MWVWALTLGLGAVDSRAHDYPVPSFDCANTTTPQELRICRSPQLSGLDGLHWHLAERAIRASADRERTRADVEGWINHVRNECQTDACLVSAYTARIAELERGTANLAPAAPPPPPLSPAPSVPAAAPRAAPAPPSTTQPARASPPPASPTEPEMPERTMWPWLLALALVVAALIARR